MALCKILPIYPGAASQNDTPTWGRRSRKNDNRIKSVLTNVSFDHSLMAAGKVLGDAGAGVGGAGMREEQAQQQHQQR